MQVFRFYTRITASEIQEGWLFFFLPGGLGYV